MGVIAEDIQTLDPTNNFKLVLEKDDKVLLIILNYFCWDWQRYKKIRKITQLENKITQLENEIKDIIKIKNHPIFKNILDK